MTHSAIEDTDQTIRRICIKYGNSCIPLSLSISSQIDLIFSAFSDHYTFTGHTDQSSSSLLPHLCTVTRPSGLCPAIQRPSLSTAWTWIQLVIQILMLLLQILRNLLILNSAHQNPASVALCVSSTMQDQSLSQQASQSVGPRSWCCCCCIQWHSRRNGLPWAASHLFNMYRIREWGSPFGIPLTVDCFRIMQAPHHHFRPPYSKHCHKYLNLCLLPLWVIRESICSSAEANVGHFPGKCLLFPVGDDDDKDWVWGFSLLLFSSSCRLQFHCEFIDGGCFV